MEKPTYEKTFYEAVKATGALLAANIMRISGRYSIACPRCGPSKMLEVNPSHIHCRECAYEDGGPVQEVAARWHDAWTARTTPAVEPEEDPPAKPEEDPPTPFPVEALPKAMRDMVGAVAAYRVQPPALCAAWALGFASACMGASYLLQYPHAQDRLCANIWLIMFAESGSGKSLVYRDLSKAITRYNIEQGERWKTTTLPDLAGQLDIALSELSNAKNVIKTSKSQVGGTGVAELSKAKGNVLTARKLIEELKRQMEHDPLIGASDVTSEGLIRALAASPREANAMLDPDGRKCMENILGRYKSEGDDASFYTKAYSLEAHSEKRSGRATVSLTAPCLAIAIAIQPDVWGMVQDKPSLTNGGFLPRAMIFDSHAPPAKILEEATLFPEAIDAAYDWALNALLQQRKNIEIAPITFAMEADARLELIRFANDVSDKRKDGGAHENYRSFSARLAENAARIALILHAFEHPTGCPAPKLSRNTVENAILIALWFFRETVSLLGTTQAVKTDARVDRLTKIYETRSATEITYRDLRKKYGFEERELDGIAAEYPQLFNKKVRDTGAKGGRPSAVLRANLSGIIPTTSTDAA